MTKVPPAYVFKKLLLTLDSMQSCATRAPNPPPDLTAMYGERAHMVSSFAMLRMMAQHCIDTIEEMTDCSLDKAKADIAPDPEWVARMRAAISQPASS